MRNEMKYERIWAEVDLDAIRQNAESMLKRVGSGVKLIAVVKMDGYGHGAVPIAHELEDRKDMYGFAVATVGRIDNLKEISDALLSEKIHFAEMSGSAINPAEVVSILINQGNTFKEGIEHVYRTVKGSCSFLILTDSCIYAARDKFGRTPIIIGKNEFGYVVASESSSFTNLGYTLVRDLGPQEAVRVSKDGITPIIAPGCRKQICSVLWVYYGDPSAY